MERHDDSRRVAITGLGLLCALGNHPETVFQRMLRSECGIGPVTRFSTDPLQCSIAAELEEEQREEVLSDEATRFMDDCARYAVYAARQALADSGIKVHAIPAQRIGLALGTCNGGILSLEKQWNLSQLDTEHTARYPFYQQGDDTARALGLGGPVITLNTACAASGNAIGYAADLIRWGYADIMLAGGSDPLSHAVYAGFNVLRALNPEPTSPFADRYGLTLGEGAAFVVLERMDRALARGAKIYGEICSYGLSNDAYHETAPHPQGLGMASAVRMALRQGGVNSSQIEYINAHGTGTQANDQAEVSGLKLVFGQDMRQPISSSKAYFGHNLGAAAAVELVTALYAIHQGYLPGTLRFDQPRAGCEGLDIVGEQMRRLQPAYWLSNNAAFGGHNVSLLVRSHPAAHRKQDAAFDQAREKKARVGVAAIGAVGYWGIRQGRVLDIPALGEQLPGKAAFSLKEFDKDRYERRMNNLTQYTIGAALAALEEAKLEAQRSEIGFIYGTARGSTDNIGRYLTSVFEKGPEFASSIHFPHTVINSIAGKTSEKLGLQGFNSSFSTGGSEGIAAAMYATGMIRTGALWACLIGAGDERSALSDAIDRAKGLDQSPYSMTEGSACMVLMDVDRAAQLGSRLYAELSGFGCSFASGKGVEVAIRHAIAKALEDSGLKMSDLDLVLWNAPHPPAPALMAKLQEWIDAAPILSLNDRYGYAESLSCILHLAAAAELVHGGQPGGILQECEKLKGHTVKRVLTLSTSLNGNCYAAILSQIPQ